MKYLIDTNVISELYKKKSDRNVIDWFDSADWHDLYISCLTIGELEAGALKKYKKDRIAGKSLYSWIERLCNDYGERILNIGQETCKIWSNLMVQDSTNAIDALIAAQALENHSTLVIRNVKHFQPFKLDMLNPFTLK